MLVCKLSWPLDRAVKSGSCARKGSRTLTVIVGNQLNSFLHFTAKIGGNDMSCEDLVQIARRS